MIIIGYIYILLGLEIAMWKADTNNRHPYFKGLLWLFFWPIGVIYQIYKNDNKSN